MEQGIVRIRHDGIGMIDFFKIGKVQAWSRTVCKSYGIFFAAFSVLALWVALVFLPGLGGDFILDDKPNITQNNSLYVEGLDHYSLGYAAMSFPATPGLRPVAMLSFGLNYWISGGFDVVDFKITNVMIHIFSVIVLFILFFRALAFLGIDGRVAFFSSLLMALFWGVHPLQVSSVLYVVQRMQTLATFFLLLALLIYFDLRIANIDGRIGVWQIFGVVFFWFMALGCKEDAILLPIYTLLLEFFIFRFYSANPVVSYILKWAYFVFCLVVIIVFSLWVIPAYWGMEKFSGRDFSAYERILTQGRVLVDYLEQIFLPAEYKFKFYYDDYNPSRDWFNPPGTFFAWVFLSCLILFSCFLGGCSKLFPLGVFVFFCGHLITSNIINLELVFEHRNHFPLIGCALIFGAVIVFFSEKNSWKFLVPILFFGWVVWLSVLAYDRAKIWGDSLRFSEYSVGLSPNSARAWLVLCGTYYRLSNGDPFNAYFDDAISACRQGDRMSNSAAALANVLILKSMNGSVREDDWSALVERLKYVPMSPENFDIPMNLIANANRGKKLDPEGISRVVGVVSARHKFSSVEYVAIADFMLHTNRREDAIKYYELALRDVRADDGMREFIANKLKKIAL